MYFRRGARGGDFYTILSHKKPYLRSPPPPQGQIPGHRLSVRCIKMIINVSKLVALISPVISYFKLFCQVK